MLATYVSEYVQERMDWSKWNLEPGLLRTPPRGTGIHIKLHFYEREHPNVIDLGKVRQIGGYYQFSPEAMEECNNFHKLIADMILRSLQHEGEKWGYMVRPRNFYFTETLQVFAKMPGGNFVCDPLNPNGTIGWKMQWVVLPRSFRKKMWKLRHGH